MNGPVGVALFGLRVLAAVVMCAVLLGLAALVLMVVNAAWEWTHDPDR